MPANRLYGAQNFRFDPATEAAYVILAGGVDGGIETRVTIGGVTSNLSFAGPTGRTATETAVEMKVTGGTALTTSSDGEPIDYGFVASTGSGSRAGGDVSVQQSSILNATQEIILWIRRLSGAGAIVVKHASLSWSEEW